MQQILGQRDSRLRTGAIVFAFLVIVTVVVVQWLVKPTPDDVVERAVERERVPLSTRAELHWQSMLLGERELFLSGLSDDVLFVVQLAPAPDGAGPAPVPDGTGLVSASDDADSTEEPIVLNGLAAVAEAFDLGVLRPLRAQGATVTVLEQAEDRVVGTVLSEVVAEEGEEGVRILEFTATVRINPQGRIFEERLEILYVAEGTGNVLNQ